MYFSFFITILLFTIMLGSTSFKGLPHPYGRDITPALSTKWRGLG
jgi:hypothetical protein